VQINRLPNRWSTILRVDARTAIHTGPPASRQRVSIHRHLVRPMVASTTVFAKEAFEATMGWCPLSRSVTQVCLHGITVPEWVGHDER
jgi:hypothetical protein